MLETLSVVVEEGGASTEVLRLKIPGTFRTGEKAVEDILAQVMGDMARKALEIRQAKLYVEADRCFRIGVSVNETRLLELKKESEVAEALKT